MGKGFTLTVDVAVAEQLVAALVATTEYIVSDVGLAVAVLADITKPGCGVSHV